MGPGITEETNSALVRPQGMFLLQLSLKQITSGLEHNLVWFNYQVLGGKRPHHKSSAISVRFDPLTSRVCVSASTDGKCYITSAFVKGVDSDDTSGPFGSV
jgi:hypothetical protein